MSPISRALRRISQAQVGPSLFPDTEEAGVDLLPDAAEPAHGKKGVLLEDLLRAQPSGVKTDLEWAQPGPTSLQATSYDDVDLIDNAAELNIGQWPKSDPASLTSHEPPDESSQATETAVPPAEQAPVNPMTIAAGRWPTWATGRPRLLILIGVATIGLATGGIMALSGLRGTAPPFPASNPRPRAEQAPVARTAAPSGIDSRTPRADPKPDVQPAAEPSAAPDGSKRGVRALNRASLKKSKLAKVAQKHSSPSPTKRRARTSVPRSAANLPRQVRSLDGATAMPVKPAKGALALYNEGTRLQKAGARDAAIFAYVQALAEDPTLIEAHNNLAVLRMHSGDTSGAEQSLQAAIGLNSRYGPAYANLGRLYIQQRRNEEAEQMLLRAASLMPATASVRNNLALLSPQLGRDEDEANAWRSALALGSEDGAVHYNLGVHYQRLGEPALARTHFEKALATKDRLSAPYRESAHRALENLKTR